MALSDVALCKKNHVVFNVQNDLVIIDASKSCLAIIDVIVCLAILAEKWTFQHRGESSDRSNLPLLLRAWFLIYVAVVVV